jgi:hypothetical protein
MLDSRSRLNRQPSVVQDKAFGDEQILCDYFLCIMDVILDVDFA